MRIDLIPDVPAESQAGKKRVVVATPTQRHKKVVGRPAEGMAVVDSSDAKYKELLQSLYDAALICDMSGRILDVNVRALEFLLYTREELGSMTIFDIISGADESLLKMLMENLENERFTLIQAYCVRRDGSFFPAEIAVNKLNLGGLRLCFFVRDITVRRQEQEMLRTEHNAIQNAGNGIAVADLEGILEYVNPAAAAMWGFAKPEELTSVDVRNLFSASDEFGSVISGVIQDHSSWTGELKARRRDGTEFDVQASAVCNRNSDGEPVGLVFSFVDISDRKRAEMAEREAERHRVMLESLGAACHHLGQPATVLLANLGIIQKKWNIDDEKIKELIQNTIEAAETLGQILHKLNTVNEYRTTKYLDRPDGADGPENRILEI